jgi:hypothetical protein
LAGQRQRRAVDGVVENALSPMVKPMTSRLIVTGMGGVGKTQVAAAASELAYGEGHVDLVVWVTATSRDRILSTYAEAAADLTGVEDDNDERSANRLLAWLAKDHGKRWLVVLDDLQTPGDMIGLWPPSRTAGRLGITFVTTRRRDSALRGPSGQFVEVGLFTQSEALSYLSERLEITATEPARDLAIALGHLPLALAQVTTYMLDRDVDCGRFLALFADRRRDLAAVTPHAESLPDDYPWAMSVTWSLSIENADRFAPVGLARPLMRIAAFLDPNGIPKQLFDTENMLSYLAELDHRPFASTPEDDMRRICVLDALHNLRVRSMISLDDDTVRVHALVQRAVRETDIRAVETAVLAVVTADALMEVWPFSCANRQQEQTLRANALALRHTMGSRLWKKHSSAGAHPVLLRVSQSLGDAVLLDDAINYTEELSREATERLGPQHRGVLAVRNELARWHGDAGHRHQARDLLASLVDDCVTILGPTDQDTLNTRQTLAYQHGLAGQPNTAVLQLTQVLEARRSHPDLGPAHPDTLNTADTLAFWLGKSGRYTEAVNLLEEILPTAETTLGSDSRDFLGIRSNLAYQIGGAGNPHEAVRAHKTVLDDQKRILGEDHRDTAVTMGNLAYWQGEAGDLSGSLFALESLLRARIKLFGPKHRDTFAAQKAIASRHTQLGNLRQAFDLLANLMPDLIEVLGLDHPETMTARHTLASVRAELGDRSTALAELHQLEKSQLIVLGPDHQDLRKTRTTIQEIESP